jgi:hypothetical protein
VTGKPLLVGALVVLSSCSDRDDTGLSEAKAYQLRAEQCLLDVRDRNLKFETSKNCQGLQALYMRWVDAVDLSKGRSEKVQLIIESAQRMAWGARAKSAANNPNLRLW